MSKVWSFVWSGSILQFRQNIIKVKGCLMQFLAKQLILSQPGGQIIPTAVLRAPPPNIFRPCDGPDKWYRDEIRMSLSSLKSISFQLQKHITQPVKSRNNRKTPFSCLFYTFAHWLWTPNKTIFQWHPETYKYLSPLHVVSQVSLGCWIKWSISSVL